MTSNDDREQKLSSAGNSEASSGDIFLGGAQLGLDILEGITNSVERMHETISSRPMPVSSKPYEPSGAHGTIAATVYASIRGVSQLLRQGVNLQERLSLVPDTNSSESPNTTRWVAALNGVCGDHLERSGNALAAPMELRVFQDGISQQVVPTATSLKSSLSLPSSNIVIFVHGLCMSEYGWQQSENGSIAESLQELGKFSALHLRYNSGRHISTNGQDFSSLLSVLCRNWPVEVNTITLVGHSMGGLVIRSACWYAEQENSCWLARLKRVLCLGSPHHGAPLEKIGHAIDKGAEKVPYIDPLMFGKSRSDGIKDLRHGDLLDEDWKENLESSEKRAVPLIDGVDYYFIAASIGDNQNDSIGTLLGDLLVRLESAVGHHSELEKRLAIEPENCRILFRKNHFDLLNDPAVIEQIVDWCA